MTSLTVAELLRPIEQGVQRWLSACPADGGADVEQAPEGEWSIKQHTFHVADGMDATRQRIASMLNDVTPDLLAFDADEWASERRYQDRPWAQARQALQQQWERLSSACGELNAAALTRTGRQANICRILGLGSDTLSLADLLQFEAQHVEEHLRTVLVLAGGG